MGTPFVLYHFEPPELILIRLGGITDAYPLVGGDFAVETVVLHPQRSVQDAAFV